MINDLDIVRQLKHPTSLRTAILFTIFVDQNVRFLLGFRPVVDIVALNWQVTSPTIATDIIKTMAPSSDPSYVAHLEEVAFQRRQGAQASIYFGAAIGGLIFVFAAAHWSTRLLNRPQIRNTSIGRTIATWLVPLRKHLHGRKIYGIDVLPERVALAIAYFGTNIGVSIWGLDWQHMNHITIFANRLGW